MKNLKCTDRWDAENYKKNASSQFLLGMNVLQSLEFREDETILDIGCGEGKLTSEMVKHVPRGKIHGIDISMNMICEARQSFSGVSNLSFECSDVTALSLKNTFDRIVSFNVFHWVENQSKALKNIYAALKPGGLLYILMVPSTKNPTFDVLESQKWAPVLQPTKAYFQGHTPETIKPLLDECGFVDVNAWVESTERVFENKKIFSDWLMTWVPCRYPQVSSKHLSC